MKKKLLLILTMLLFITIVKAAYFERLSHTITQPNGKTINCFVSGDEFFNWIHDEAGYTIIQAPNGYYYYGQQNGDLVEPSSFLVGEVNPENIGLKKWAKISKTEYNRRFNAMFAYENDPTAGPSNAPHSGTLNNIVVYIRFSDDAEFIPTRQTYDDKFNPTTGNTLKTYYQEVSYNNLTISSTHYPACALTTNLSYQDANPRAYYQPYNATTNPTGYDGQTERTTREHTLLVNTINWINTNSAVSSSLNLDGDNDGNVDNVCFIIKGNSGGWSELLWAHRWSLYSQTVYINSKRVYDYTFQPENQVDVQTLCHEMFHALGAPDLYHYTSNGVSPVSSWDLMESGGGHMLTYMKWKYSNNTWINTIPQITTTGTYTLNPVTSATNNCYKIASPNSTTQYFMVEYRKKTGTFENNIPGSGLIVYRIDPTISGGNRNGPPDEVYVYRPGGSSSVNGSPSSAHFSSTVSRTAINDATNPSSFLQNGTAGGLNISNVTTAGTTISFDVTFPIACTPPTTQASAFTSSSIADNSMTIGWTRGSGNSVLVVARLGSAVNDNPVNGATYSANAALGSGTQIGTGNYVVYNGAGSSVNLTALTSGTTCYYAIYEYNSSTYCYLNPALTASATTTGIPPCIFCASSGNLSFQTSTTLVNFNTLNNISAKPDAYSDYTGLSTSVNKNSTYNLTVNINTDGAYTIHAWAWIDWNQDCDFLDSGEAYDLGTALNTTDGATTLSPLSITIPATALTGNTRMRVSSKYNSDPTSCETGFDGEVEDYTINITSTSCTPVVITTQPTISQTTCTPSSSTTFSVAANTGTAPITYQWQYNNSGTWQNVTNGIPTGATYTNGTSDTMTVSGITSANTFQYRCYLTNCSGTNNTTSNIASLVVNIIPSAAGSISGATSICQNQTAVTYTVPAIAYATSYIWTLPNGANGTSSTNTINIDYTSSFISGNITVKGQNSCGIGLLSTIAITVSLLPTNQILLNEPFDYPIGSFLSGLGWTAHSGVGTNTIPIVNGNLNYNAYPLSSGQMVKLLNTGEDVNKVFGPKTSNTTFAAFLVKIINASVTGDYFAHFIKAGTNTVFAGRVFVKQDPSNSAKILFGVGKSTNLTIPGTVYSSSSFDTNLTHLIVLKYTANSATTNDDVISLFIDPSISEIEETPSLIATDVATDIDSSYLGFALRQGTSTSSPSLYIDGIRIASSWKEALGLNLNQSIIGQANVCQGQNNVSYTVPESSNATSYIWSLPVGATGTSTTNSIIVNYSNSAISGNIIVKAHNACGDGDSSALAITVNPLPTISGIIYDTRCGAGIVNLAATTASGTINWYSNFTGGSTIHTGTNFSPSILQTTTFYADVTNNGCTSYPRTALTATIKPVPLITSTTSDTICVPGNVTLSATASSGTINWYLDSISTSPIASGTSFSTSITATTNYYVDAIENGCSSPTRTLIIATLGTSPVVIANTTATNVCEGVAVTLSGSGTAGVTYTWDNGVLNGIPFYPTETKTYILTGINASGCQNTASVFVSVNPAPAVNPISGAATLCEGTFNSAYTVALHTYGQPLPPTSGHGIDTTDQADGAVNNYSWSFSGNATIIPTTIVNAINMNFALGSTSGILTVVETDPSTGCSRSNQLNITVNPFPVNAEIISGSNTVCAGENNVIYTVPIITNATSYAWTLPTGTTGISNTNSITVNYGLSAISGNITVKGNNSCGDGNTSILPITVNPLPESLGTISGTSTVCQGESDVVYSVPANTNASSYIWTLPSGATGSSVTNSIIVNYGSSAVSGSITVKAHNSCGDGYPSTLAITVNERPTITESISDTLCGAGIVTLGATTTSGTINWYSNFTGGSSIHTGTYYSPSIFQTNTFYADVTNNGCTSYPRIAVTATIKPLPSIISTLSDTICASGIATLAATTSLGTINWYLDSISVTPIAFGPSFSPTIPSTTNYYVDATYDGCTSLTRSLVVANVGALPIVIANATSTNICEGLAVTLSGSGTTGVTYTWDNNVIDGIPFNPNNTKTYTLTGTTLNGCQNTDTIIITIIPAPPINPISGTTTLCEGTLNSAYAVALHTFGQPLPPTSGHGADTDQPDGAVNNYEWSYSGTAIINATTNVNAINMDFALGATSGILTVVETDPTTGCSKSNHLVINLNPAPPDNPIIGTTTLCEGTLNSTYSVALHTYGQPLPPNSGHGVDTSDQADGAVNNYVWSYNGIAIINSTNAVNAINMNFALGSTSGILTVTETNPSTACNRSNQLSIIVNPLPLSPEIISGLNTVCQGQNIVNYSIPIVANATSYNWTLPTGAIGFNESNNIAINYSNNAVSGNIKVKGHNECGDGNPSILAITVNPLPYSAGIISGSSIICQGESNTIYTIPAITNASSYNWTLPSGTIGTSSTNSISVDFETTFNSGNITVRGINSCGNGDSSTLAITIAPPPLVSTFTAAVSNVWEKCENWDQGIPGPLTNASIAASKLAIVNSNNYTCKNLTIEPLGKLTINAGKNLTVADTLLLKSDISGTASLIDNGTLYSTTNIVERYIPHTFTDEFHMLASPVTSQAISPAFNEENGFFVWDEPTGNWIEFADVLNFTSTNGGTNFIPGKGYAVSYPNIVTKRFKGNLNTGSVNIPLTVSSGLNSGWNFIANPYPSAINWNASSGWNRTMLENADQINNPNEKAIWIWNAQTANYGAFISNTDAATNGVSRNISISQGFWVKATTTGTLAMNNEVREHADQAFLKSSSADEMLRLKVTNAGNTYSDELIINFGNAGDQGGAEKMFTIESTAPSIYSMKLNKNWSINYLTTIDQHSIIPIGFKAGVDGNYNIHVSNINTFNDNTNVYLKDLATNTITDLRQSSDYHFTAIPNENANRFQLLFQSPQLGISNNIIENTSIYSYNNAIYINSNETIKEIAIYNTLGQLIKILDNKNGKANFTMDASTIYLVRVITSKTVVSKKVFVN